MINRTELEYTDFCQFVSLSSDSKLKPEKMGSSGENEAKYFSLEEVSNHNKSRGEDRSIWMVIHDKVYDVTKFLDEVKVIVNVTQRIFNRTRVLLEYLA